MFLKGKTNKGQNQHFPLGAQRCGGNWRYIPVCGFEEQESHGYVRGGAIDNSIAWNSQTFRLRPYPLRVEFSDRSSLNLELLKESVVLFYDNKAIYVEYLIACHIPVFQHFGNGKPAIGGKIS